MKKSAFLFVLMFVGQAFGQGLVLFANRAAGVMVDGPISYAPGTPKGGDSGVRVNGSGTGATAMAGLFAGPDGATEEQLVFVGPAVNFRGGTGAGYVNSLPLATRTLDVAGAKVPAGEYAMLQVRAWDTGNTNDTWQQVLGNTNAYRGRSNLLRIQTGGGDPPLPPGFLTGLQPFNISFPYPSPLVNPILNQTNLAGLPWLYQLPTNAFLVSSPGQVISLSVPLLPSGVSFDSVTRSFLAILNVAGTYPITVVATDNSIPPNRATNRFVLVVTNRLFTLSVSRTGSGSGYVVNTYSNIVCGDICTAYVPAGTNVALVATPQPGSGFAGWSGACTGTGICTVGMSEDRVVTARFVSTVLEVAAEGEGSVSKSPDKLFYELGEVVTLTAYPPRWYGVRWSDGVTTNPRAVTIGESNQYTAFFYPTTALETVTYDGITRVAPVGMPVIFVNGQFVAGPAFTNRGPAEVSILSTLPEGTIRYTLNNTDPLENGSIYTAPFKVSKDAFIRAVAFSTNSIVTVPCDPVSLVILPTVFVSTPGGGTVVVTSPGELFKSNDWASVAAIPAEGWQFVEWRGDAEGTETSAMVRLDRNRCVEAIFGTTLNITAEEGGSVQQSPLSSVLPYGTVAQLTPVPDADHYFLEWGGAASGHTKPLALKITNPNPTVVSLFAPLRAYDHTLTVLTEGGGTVLVEPDLRRYRSYMRTTLTAIPMAGQVFLGWSGDVFGMETNNPTTLRMNKTRVLAAHFTRNAKLAFEHCEDDCNPGSLRTILSGPADTRYAVEVSTDLADWIAIGTVTNLYGTVQVHDPLRPENCVQRYYRAILLP